MPRAMSNDTSVSSPPCKKGQAYLLQPPTCGHAGNIGKYTVEDDNRM
jgi:hypothetical protein